MDKKKLIDNITLVGLTGFLLVYFFIYRNDTNLVITFMFMVFFLLNQIPQDTKKFTSLNYRKIQDFKKVKLKDLVPREYNVLTKEEANIDVWVKS